MANDDRSSAQNLQQDYAGYKVFDEHYEEIGKVDDLFVDENDRPEYIGVKMGFLGMNSTLIPMDLVRANDKREILEVAASKDAVKNAPSFDDDQTVSPEHEAKIRQHYGLSPSATRDPGGDYASSGSGGVSGVDLEYGERAEPGEHAEPGESYETTSRTEPRPDLEERQPPPRDREEAAPADPPRAAVDDNELRVQRTEEELRAGTREREAGAVNVRKRVRTDREQVRVPKRREEVTVERVPVSEETPAGQAEQRVTRGESGEEEIRVPVVEEEVVVEKRPVVKEELRIKKKVVEEDEIVEADVRKEEVEIEDETNYRDR